MIVIGLRGDDVDGRLTKATARRPIPRPSTGASRIERVVREGSDILINISPIERLHWPGVSVPFKIQIGNDRVQLRATQL